MASGTRYARALALLDAAHSEDPNKVTVNGRDLPYELHYAQKMTSYLEQRMPQASELLSLSIRAQHFRRWEVPRSSYPMTRPGYYSWRTFLKKRQAEQASSICKDCGFSAEEAERIAALIRKEDLKEDTETQALEDVACLVFLDDQFEEFEKSHDEEKIIGILRKTWGKMSPEGQAMALAMKMDGRPKELMEKALNG
ncbi:MAG: hypothetical protein M1828_005708 [Chrysothrix sp. TS-e1954]|nr:MAG: hypothetical protein M1828_005708 [Chrysothrix sp. TS-e1954]